MQYGYARVSTEEQTTRAQIDALRAHGVQRIFEDTGSGIGPRPQLQKAIATLRPGDTLLVWKIDRIARSLSDLLSTLGRIKAAGAMIKSLTEPIDTTSSIGEFTLQILGAVAQLERNLIRERSMAGQRAAMARGIHCGRGRGLAPDDEADLVRMYLSGGYTLARVFNVHAATAKRAIYRVTKPTSSSLV